MADLALYTLPEHWPNAVASIIETMKKASLQIVSTLAYDIIVWSHDPQGDNWQSVLLELLTVLPEEVNNSAKHCCVLSPWGIVTYSPGVSTTGRGICVSMHGYWWMQPINHFW